MITIILIMLSGYFGFLIGRRYTEGIEEQEREEFAEAARGRSGVRLRNITIRR